MRKVLLVTGLFVATGTSAIAVPVMNSGSTPAHVQQDAEGSWKLPRMWGKKEEAPNPQFFYRQPKPQQTTTQKFTSAVTDNSMVQTAKDWMTPDPKTPKVGPQSEPLPLSKEVTRPTPALMVSMAQIRERQGDIAGARQTYLQALAVNPKSVKTLREIGHFEDRQGQMTDAESYYAEAAKLEPTNAPVLNDLALCMARQGKLAPAVQVLDKAIRLDPSKPLYRNNMATVLMEMGEQHGAMQHLMAVHTPAAAYYNMGHLLEKGGQSEAAAAHYAEALRLDPTLSAAESALAKVIPNAENSIAQESYVAPQAPLDPQTIWPSEPITRPVSTRSNAAEPEFGPQLLPPME